jgi:hypothetical protein
MEDNSSFNEFKKFIDADSSIISDKTCRILYIASLFEDKWKYIFSNIYEENNLPTRFVNKVDAFIAQNQKRNDDKWIVISKFINDYDIFKNNNLNNINAVFNDSSHVKEFVNDIVKLNNENETKTFKEKLKLNNICLLYLGNAYTLQNMQDNNDDNDYFDEDVHHLITSNLDNIKHVQKMKIKKELSQGKYNINDKIEGVIQILRVIDSL